MGTSYAAVRISWTSSDGRSGDAFQDHSRVLVAGLHTLEVHDGDPAQAVQLPGEAHIDDGIHRGRQDRDAQ